VRCAWRTPPMASGPAPRRTKEGDAATFELVVAGRALSDSADADVAIMMVEAGGTEGSFEKYADGAPKVSEEVLSAGLEASKLWIRESINLQRELVKNFVAARGEITPMQFQAIATTKMTSTRASEAMGATSLTEANKLTTKTRATRPSKSRRPRSSST